MQFVNTFAKAKEVKLVLDFRKRSKGKMINLGLAYVKLEDEKSLTEALKEVERTHMDRQIKIIRAKPLSERPPRTFEPRENAKEEVKPRAPRAPRGAPRENRPPRVEGDRPPRQEGDRPPRKEGDRPPRREGDRP